VKALLIRARGLLRIHLLLSQLGLAILVTGLSVAWLRIPDSSVFAIALSLLTALVIAAVALGGESFLLLQTCPISYSDGRKRMQLGAVALLFAALIWFGWNTLLANWSAKDFLLAGYLNSQAPAHLRNFFSFTHISAWLEDARAVLRWFAAGLLLAASLGLFLAMRRARAIGRLILSMTYWIVFALTALAGSYLTHTLVGWMPGHGLGVESISLVLRLGTVILVDLVLACFLFTTAIAVILRSDESSDELADRRAGLEPSHPVPAGAPEPSQLRT